MSDPDELLVPTGTRVVHIGPHKTGSTSLQTAARARRRTLRTYGVHYAGRGQRPRKAVWALGIPGGGFRVHEEPEQFWYDLVDEVGSAEAPRVLISNEDLGRADEDQAARVVADLGGPQVHVVAVARRLDRYLASQWQQRVRSGERRSYDDWLRMVLDGPDERERRNVWQAHDIPGLLDRWVRLVGPHRFTLVVSDDRDRGRLPRTFESMLGLPTGTLEAGSPGTRTNSSLGWAETELVRGLFALHARRGWPRAVRSELINKTVVRTLLEQHRQPGERSAPPLPAWAADRLRELGEARIAAIEDSGVRVLGDLASQQLPEDCETVLPPYPSAPDVPQASVLAAIEGLLVASGRTSAEDRT